MEHQVNEFLGVPGITVDEPVIINRKSKFLFEGGDNDVKVDNENKKPQ